MESRSEETNEAAAGDLAIYNDCDGDVSCNNDKKSSCKNSVNMQTDKNVEDNPVNKPKTEGTREKNTNDNEVVIRQYKGVVIGAKNMGDIEEMEIRNDDLFVVTFPRSGTTLVQEMSFLISTGDYDAANHVLLDDRFPYLDFDLRGPLYPLFRGVKFIDEKQSPRFVKSHLHHFLLPRQLRDGKGKIIYVARNPRDALVSYYKLQKWFRFETRSFLQFYEDFMAGMDILCGPYWTHVKEFWEVRDKPNILFLKFEDIIKDMTGAAKQISLFLGKQRSDCELAKVVEHCQIQNMKKNPTTNWTYKEKLQQKDHKFGSFINTGRTGDVAGFYTEEMLKRLHTKFEQEFHDTGLVFPSFP